MGMGTVMNSHGPMGDSMLSIDGTDRQTDGRTPYRYIDAHR